MNNYVILHGSFGSKDGNWFPWLKGKIEEKKFEAEKEFADTVSNEQYIIKNGGHINAETGYTEFAEVLKSLDF